MQAPSDSDRVSFLMAKTSPADWIFRSMSAIAALQFLEGETPLEDLLVEARSALASQYPDDLRLTDDMAALATEMLGALVKLEAPDPPAILRAYAANSLLSNPDGGARKLKIVRADDQRLAQRVEQLNELSTTARVESCRRFVKDKDARLH
jgi:hypothetical protein